MDRKLIGKNLKYIRRKSGIKRDDFSEEIHMSTAALAKQEQGSPTLDLVIRYSKYFKVSIDDICLKDLKNEK
jgi:DNA-binding XRE family transcriptional regulator